MRLISHGGYILLLVTGLILIMTGCTTVRERPLPPVTEPPSGVYHAGKVIWHDLLTEDVNAAARFYSSLFGWQIQLFDKVGDYLVISSDDKAIGGIARHENEDDDVFESLWLISLSVADIDRAIEVTLQHEGRVLDGPFDVEGRGRMAIIEDPLGAPLILLRTFEGDPPDRKPEMRNWLWADLLIQNEDKAKAFYADLVGYETRWLQSGEDYSYRTFYCGEKPRAGLVVHRFKGVEPHWLPYVKVDDLDAVIEKARSLDGKLILRTEEIAVLMDPTGAAFGIQSLQ